MSTTSPSSRDGALRDAVRPAVSVPRALAALGAVLLAAAAWHIAGVANHRLWLDELYTTTLVATPRLGHVWDGAMRGVDGNPPLYLSLGWLLIQALPGAPEQVLRALNLVLLSATAVLLYRIGRRFADPGSVVAGLTALCAVDGMVGYALLEVRTYALYLMLATAALWAVLGVVDRPSRGRVALLAALGVLTTLAHSFGGFYVLAMLGGAACVALANRDGARLRSLAAAAVPVAATLLLWIRLSLPAQLAVASPYGWIPRPELADLAEALSGSLLLTPVLLLGLACIAIRRPPRLDRLARRCAERPDLATLAAALAGFAGLTAAGWIGAQLITPFFVSRYFIPNVIVAAVLIVAAFAGLRRGVDAGFFTVAVVACIALGFGSVAVAPGAAEGAAPCLDGTGRFLEEGLAVDGVPVVAESPHAWFPRSRYAPTQATLYPLDWAVVLGYPARARNNAMDFHIMEILRDWAAPGSALATEVMTTREITARHRHLLVLDEDARSWFTHLAAAGPVSARLLRQGQGCRVLDVTLPEGFAGGVGR